MTIVADLNSMTGITTNGQFVEYSFAVSSWVDAETGKRVTVRQITWVTLDDLDS